MLYLSNFSTEVFVHHQSRQLLSGAEKTKCNLSIFRFGSNMQSKGAIIGCWLEIEEPRQSAQIPLQFVPKNGPKPMVSIWSVEVYVQMAGVIIAMP